MRPKAVIPCLDVKDGKLVKGVHFVELRQIGDPAEAAAAYDEAGADELVFLDITATIERRKTTLDAVRRTARRIKVPLTVGGGVGSLDDMQRLFDAGAAKVSINTAAVVKPGLIRQAAEKFGPERITVAIDARKSRKAPSGFQVMARGGRKATGIDVQEWARQVEVLGAGAILATSMDADGTQAGYDIRMTRAIATNVSLPVIASGGAGKLEHLSEAILFAKAAAVLVASIAHFGIYTIRQMKEHLASCGIPVRLPDAPPAARPAVWV